MATNASWHARVGEEELGPLSGAELRALAKQGKLTPQDQIRKGDSSRWRPASDVKGLFPQNTAPPDASESADEDDGYGLASLAEMEREAQSLAAPGSLLPAAAVGAVTPSHPDSAPAPVAEQPGPPPPPRRVELSQTVLLIGWGVFAGGGVLVFGVIFLVMWMNRPPACDAQRARLVATLPVGVDRYLIKDDKDGQILLVRVSVDPTQATTGDNTTSGLRASDFKLFAGARELEPTMICDGEEHQSKMRVPYAILSSRELTLPFLLGEHDNLRFAKDGSSYSDSDRFGQSSSESHIDYKLLPPATGVFRIDKSFSTHLTDRHLNSATVSGSATIPIDGGEGTWDFDAGEFRWTGDWVGHASIAARKDEFFSDEKPDQNATRRSLLLLFEKPVILEEMKLQFRDEKPTPVPAP